jgi:peptidoglycan/LPS O-acetylase OafA/YrhL
MGDSLPGGKNGTRTTSLVSVQALRALAAMSVVLVHFEYVDFALTDRINQPLSLYPLASGVDLFFVISGFIMVYSSAGLFAKDGAWRIFISRRLSRIAPLYWLMTAAAIAMFAAPENWKMLISSLLFIPYRTEAGSFFPIDAGGWTLNYEMFFYVLFACVIFLSRRSAVATVCVFLVLLVTIFNFIPPIDDRLLYWSDPLILEFCIGMVIGLLHQQYRIKLPAMARLGLIVIGIGAVWLSRPDGSIPSGMRTLVWGVPAALLLAGAVLGPEPDFRWLARPARVLGDASYALYLIHPIVGGAVIRGCLAMSLSGDQLSAAVVAGIPVAILLSLAVFHYFERPMMRLLLRLLERRPTILPRPRTAAPSAS